MRKMLVQVLTICIFISTDIVGESLDKVGPALNYWYNFYFDPEWIEHVEDSMKSRQPIRLGDSLEYYPPPRIEPGEPWLPISRAPIELVGGVPYVDALVRYSGNGSDLRTLGIQNRHVDGASSALVRLPLVRLPELISLPSVHRIPDRTRVELALDDSRADVKVHLIHQNPGYKGKGVRK